MQEPEQNSAPRRLKAGLNAGSVLLFLAGLSGGSLSRELMLGAPLFAVGGMLFALRGYLDTCDKAVVTGALTFATLVAIRIEALVYFLGLRVRT
jgi:hypothetical protein